MISIAIANGIAVLVSSSVRGIYNASRITNHDAHDDAQTIILADTMLNPCSVQGLWIHDPARGSKSGAGEAFSVR